MTPLQKRGISESGFLHNRTVFEHDMITFTSKTYALIPEDTFWTFCPKFWPIFTTRKRFGKIFLTQMRGYHYIIMLWLRFSSTKNSSPSLIFILSFFFCLCFLFVSLFSFAIVVIFLERLWKMVSKMNWTIKHQRKTCAFSLRKYRYMYVLPCLLHFY